MPFAQLNDRALISVSGPDAEHLLQNILTTDLDTLGPGQAKPGALLAPQGKILFDFLISRVGDNGFRLECRADIADDFVRRLMLYRLRAKADIAKQDQVVVTVAWGDDSTASSSDSTALADTRFRDVAVGRAYAGGAKGGGDPDGWKAVRIANGVAESGSDYQLGDAFPHDVLLDETGGVGFKKGCYIGQEVVSRMQHRGTARRRVLIVSAESTLPASGTELTVAGRPVGALGSVDGKIGLAIARIDRIKAALDAGEAIMAGDVPVTLAIPAWAKFSFPQDAATAEEA
ncbi:folate-binding protein [Mesorhizobium sp. M2D.F.Ca.ET.185.01.1.1]|uniref:CAF17-like 4Fe-4S cluster assembly/insertion protein YgfZ n=1 Tax=unclassified Mesorhizobium TaxID=325217 RepID=UPI000FCACDB6|nr:MULTISPECIES: folate-binding protein YgfZ [unclassified Mesorhizobium]TGP76419.1 folate-binding protein [bacterium M00.F.Ca.ET.227.01.1.1]TGP92471.1 folate-binding protein [bacterium M00.F.Ca.ET.222.01.1.1]TGP97026.1 folate-binding protein [bacterium M00.F.Ca.ET.221.01.1.1]TGT68518.1 folate-binding protein [bacterium M00.F.Ca.ET.159.01.1.1]TGT80353.1 folate-binding protein [bacterium M00.F.Ca.ET.157.01.1.1]TGU06515.1 folate-binding protein [bacterium M00.F.Ca.ET.163.01.1.1]TGU27860.1 fola